MEPLDEALKYISLLKDEKGYSIERIANSIGVLPSTVERWLERKTNPQKLNLIRLRLFYRDGQTFDPPEHIKRKPVPNINNISDKQLLAELKRRGINLATIEEADMAGIEDYIILIDGIITVPKCWVITPLNNNILKRTGGPITTLWHNQKNIKPDSKIVKLSEAGKK